MNETSKVRERLLPLLTGRIIDIGCGTDPVLPTAEPFDRPQGDAQELREPAESFDTVYSSHTLEHMPRPLEALLNWWNLVKPGGLMIILVPDMDAYEQGVWPSINNGEHCHGFTLLRTHSWCPATVNLLDYVKQLPRCRVMRAEIIDERPPDAERKDWTMDGLICHIELVLQKLPVRQRIGSTLRHLMACPRCQGSLVLDGFHEQKAFCRCKYCGAVCEVKLKDVMDE